MLNRNQTTLDIKKRKKKRKENTFLTNKTLCVTVTVYKQHNLIIFISDIMECQSC